MKPTIDKVKGIWDEIASFWDENMGEGNAFHLKLVLPSTLKLLDIKAGDKILDAGCGNGQFARYLAELGHDVVAFDLSQKMIDIARAKSKKHPTITYHALDLTDPKTAEILGENVFDKIACNMTLMDVPHMDKAFDVMHKLLNPGGVCVFSIMHPCFNAPGSLRFMRWEVKGNESHTVKGVEISSYIEESTVMGAAMHGQPRAHYYFNRPLNQYMNQALRVGFNITGFDEPVFSEEDLTSHSSEKLSDVFLSLPPVAVFKLEK